MLQRRGGMSRGGMSRGGMSRGGMSHGGLSRGRSFQGSRREGSGQEISGMDQTNQEQATSTSKLTAAMHFGKLRAAISGDYGRMPSKRLCDAQEAIDTLAEEKQRPSSVDKKKKVRAALEVLRQFNTEQIQQKSLATETGDVDEALQEFEKTVDKLEKQMLHSMGDKFTSKRVVRDASSGIDIPRLLPSLIIALLALWLLMQ